jgi:uncharacterized LabA/DUF88 family protein
MEYASDCDVVLLASGDGDFDLLVQKAREKFGIEFEICGVPKLTAESLIKSADKFIPIESELLL